MSDTDRRPLMEAPQMCVHYCEEKECEEWGGWGNGPFSGRGDPLEHFPHKSYEQEQALRRKLAAAERGDIVQRLLGGSSAHLDRRRRRHGKMQRAEHAVAGEGVPFVPGIDTPPTHAKCMSGRKLALVADERPKELLAERILKVMFSGMDPRMQRNERAVSRRRP